jgi:sodium/potassium-transporting ATPase subunit alpha
MLAFARIQLMTVADWSSSRVMSSIKNLMPDNCLVLRDGTRKEVVATELVPGDLLYIRLGDKLPANVRYVEASPDVKFDRSILTGEVEPLRGVVDSSEKNYASTNDVFNGVGADD